VYIGQSRNIKSRVRLYVREKCKNQIKLQNSLTFYGWSKHSFEIVHELPEDINQEALNKYEVFYWQQYKDCGIEMLNVREPGSKGKTSVESIQKMIETKRRNGTLAHTEERKKLIGLGNRGKKRSEAHNKRNSDTHQGFRPWTFKPVIDLRTQITYESIKAAAKGLSFSTTRIHGLLKQGIFKKV
jgi:group I intron endonuclease